MKKVCSIILLLLFVVVLNFGFKVNAVYVNKSEEFRGVWVTPHGGDSELVTYVSESDFKENMNYVLEVMEENNLNAMIFHVRTHNNALYKSTLNPVSSYWSSVNFNTFDPLAWLIDECHKRGIEFHAWLNPYRISSSSSATPSSIASQYASFPNNPASDEGNILLTKNSEGNTAGAILNPGLPEVRTFIVNTINEIIDNYEVDAIHFDDYFYANLGANGSLSGATTILNEPDQTTFEAYKGDYVITSAQDKASWRRDQIDLLIEGVSQSIRAKNTETGKYIQFGIAPTGIYKNGNGTVTYDTNGNAVTNGSATSGQTHYSSYLFCDSLNWINNEWIDYILPQSYWGFTHTAAGYDKVMSWWDKVVKNKKVNLYSGIGLYMAYTGTVLTKDKSGNWVNNTNTYSWETDPDELEKQLTYITTLENVSGASIYNFSNFRKKHDNSPAGDYVITQMANMSETYWNRPTLLPEIKNMDRINLGKVSGFNINDKTISWNRLDNAKYYAIYRSSSAITFDSSELIDVVGGNVTSFTDSVSGYTYGIKPISYSNTLGEGEVLNGNGALSIAGAQVRTTGNAGIRFVGRIDDTLDKTNVSKYGIALAYGEAFADTSFIVGGTVNGKSVVTIEVDETTDNGLYYGTLYGIPENMYVKNISSRAYAKLKDGSYIYSNTVTTRSLANVSYLAASDGFLQDGNIIDNVVTYVNSNYKKITMNDDKTITIASGLKKENDLDKLKEMFIADYNREVGSTLSISSTASAWYNDGKSTSSATAASNYDISDSKMYTFFNKPKMKTKWGWILAFLKSVDGTVHCTNQIIAIEENGQNNGKPLYYVDHFIYSLYNMFNKTHIEGGYTSIDFTSNTDKYNEFSSYNKIYINLNDYEIVKVGSSYVLPEALEAPSGKTWDGWYIGDTKYDASSSYEITSSDVTFTPTFNLLGSLIGSFNIVGYNTQGAVEGNIANYGIRMYSSVAGITSSLHWYKVAIKWDNQISQYKVTAIADTGIDKPTDYDYLILVWEGDTSTYNSMKNIGINVGDVIVLSEIPTTIGHVDISASIYRP